MSSPLRATLLLCAIALVAIALLAARPIATPGPPLRDFEAYWSAGASWNARANPYGRAIWKAERGIGGVDRSRDEVLPYVGPPFALPVWGIFARLPFALAARVWGALLVAALLALVAVVVRGTLGRLDAFAVVAALALAVAFGPVTSDLALGQVALVALLGTCIAVAFADRSLLAAAAGGFVAAGQPNVALGAIAAFGRYRVLAALVVAAIAAYLVGALAAGWNWPVRYAGILAAHAAAERFTAIQIGPAAIAYGLGASASEARIVAAIAAIAAIAGAVALARRVRDGFGRFAAFGALAPFVSGFFHEHDLIVAYVAAVWCALRAHGAARAVALCGTLLASIDWLGLAQRPTGSMQSALLASAACCTFVALGTREDLRWSIVPAGGVAALFAAGALAGSVHPAPIWPDALGRFHTLATTPIATVWFEEQRATGLLAVTPAWAFLRALSLAGCALLAYAIYRRSSCRRTASTHPDAIP